ncbi:MAG: serine/threonine-protein kinase, partial [bacterium]
VFRVLSNAKPFIAKCVAPRREHRYQTFAAMLEDFRKIRARRIRHKNKDEYELLAVLGRGGFGEVFKARRISDGSLVAVKHLFAEKQSDRFIKEAKILQQYPHPNLCKYVDFMVVEGTAGEKQYFLILEYLEGMPGWTLRTRLKNEGRLEAAEAMPLFIGYLSALQFLHENSRPIIHRDIKPGNLYAPVGQPDKGKVFDLGVARDVSGTVTVGGVPGTLDYMPPEFAEAGGDRGSPQSDLYALGLCLYESVAGKPVYERLPTDLNSAWVAFQQRLRKPLELTFTADAFRQYPRLKSIIFKSLAARPVDRYSSAAGMKRDLEAVLSGQGGGEAEPSDEVTMATLHSFADDDELRAPEPGATVGTRALDGMGGTLPAPMGLLAAGRAEAERRRRKKRLTLIAAAAAAVVLVLLVSLIIGTVTGRHSITAAQNMNQAREAVEQVAGELRVPVPTADYARTLSEAYAAAVKTGQQYPEISGRIDEQRQQMRRSGAALPAEFKRSFEAALKADKADKAEGLLKEWQGLSAYADILGLTAQQYAERSQVMKSALLRFPIERDLASLHRDIPASIQDDNELEKGEAAAARLKTLRDRAWPGFDEVEKQQQLAALASTLSERTLPAIARLRDAALVLYREGQNGDAEREALLKFSETHPALAWIAQATYLDAKNSVESARQSRLLSGGMSKVMDLAANARDERGMIAVTAELASLEGTPALRITPGQFKAAEEAISAKYLVFAGEHARKAREAFNAARMAEGQQAQKALAELVDKVPERFGKVALAALVRDVEAQRAGAQARQDQAAASQHKARQDAGTALTEVRTMLRKGDIRASVSGLAALSTIPASQLGDKEFKAEYEAVVTEYARLVETAVAQKDPLDQRSQRLQSADEILNGASAETVFAGRIKALRDQLAVQKAVMIIRFINRAGQPVRVSGEDLKDRLTLATESVKDVELKVRSTNSPLSFLVEGDAKSKPRIESVTLAGAGGREVLLTKLDKEQEPVKEPAAQVSGGREQAPATLPPARKTVSEGRGVLDIMVSPKTATLMVDGNSVPAGRIEV